MSTVTFAENQAAPASSYDAVARGLHWLTVLLVLAEYIVGSVMPGIHLRTPFVFSIRLHLALGSGLLLIVLVRLLWRLTHRPPPAPHLPVWQRRIANGTHFALY